MAKRIYLTVLAIILIPAIAMCFSSSVSTGKISSSSAVISGPGFLTDVIVRTDGSNAATVTLYDGTNTSGTEIFSTVVDGANYTGGWIFNFPLQFKTGIYVTISGTGAYCYIGYARN